ncbi:MAG: peptide ABC transporter permease [Candidatus Roseilinea sp.]|nr:MAG: peptide ABC transporter permease [Candidatus Roseilinea sp.]
MTAASTAQRLTVSTASFESKSAGHALRCALRFARRFKAAAVGLIFLVTISLGALFAPTLTPHHPTLPRIAERFKPPGREYLLGTDDLGRDIATRILYGARNTLTAGVLSVLLATLIGSAVGVVAAYRGGWLDNLFMRAMDVMLSFPAILLAILIVASLRPGMANLVAAIAFSLIPTFARVVRSVVLGLKHQDHITASQALGASHSHVVFRHIVPNTLPMILIQATASLAIAISTAAALNYLGLGVEPPQPDWGLMVAEGQKHVFSAAYIPLIPGLFITAAVLSVNFIGDALRDSLDPMLK